MKDTSKVQPWYRQFWPWFIIALPLTTVIASIVTIWIAVNNEGGLVSENYYQDGLSINQQLELEQRAREAGVSATLLFSEADQLLTLYLQGEIPMPKSLTLKLASPVDPEKDLTFHLIQTGNNLFRSKLKQSPSGRYYTSLAPENNSWHIKGQLHLPHTDPIVFPGSDRTPRN